MICRLQVEDGHEMESVKKIVKKNFIKNIFLILIGEYNTILSAYSIYRN